MFYGGENILMVCTWGEEENSLVQVKKLYVKQDQVAEGTQVWEKKKSSYLLKTDNLGADYDC